MEPGQRFEIINVVFAPPVSMQTKEFYLYMYMYKESLLLGEPLIPLGFYLRQGMPPLKETFLYVCYIKNY